MPTHEDPPDDERRAVIQAVRILDALTPDAQHRVVRTLAAHYDVQPLYNPPERSRKAVT